MFCSRRGLGWPGAMADGERPRSSLSQASSVLTISSVSLGAAKPSRSLRRVHTFGKRENSIKRDPNAPVVIRGWLCKQFTDRVYPSLGATPPRARLHGRLISPHSASSGYLHLPPLPPVTSRPLGKRTSLGAPPRTVAPLSRDRTLLALPRAESDTDILLTKLCGQDKLLRGLEEETGQLRAEKERLEKALELLRHQLHECQGQELAEEKIWYQQRRLQDELVQVRARLCDLALAVPAGGREEDRATRGDAWGSWPPQSPSRKGAGSPGLDRGRPLQETDVAAPGLSSLPATPHSPQSPSPGPQEPQEQRTEELPAKAITMDPPGPHRARMSVQEQLERMRRHQEGQRQQGRGRPNPWGSQQGSLRASASRLPLPTHPSDLGPEPTQTHTEPPLKGGQTSGPWGWSPPPLERDRHRVITLAYALATEASERSKLITGKNPPEPQLRANPDPPPGPLDAVTNQHVLFTPTLPWGHPEANHVEAEPCGPANRNTAFSSNSVQQAGAANQASSVAELSNWFSPLPEAANHSARLSEAANPTSLLSKGSHWAPPLPTLANQTSTSHETSNRESPLLWAAQKECGDWVAEQRIVGNKGVANGRCQGWGGRAVPRQVVAYLGEGSQPIRITLLQSSF
nr:pleckstrin homology domain-containing family A member 4-like [Chelonoidis abingdonii]